jgi:hypothetical protein
MRLQMSAKSDRVLLLLAIGLVVGSIIVWEFLKNGSH